jgi:hypothetical protein
MEDGDHWYDLSKQPCHGASLSRARRQGLLPSFSTISDLENRKELQNWILNENIETARTTLANGLGTFKYRDLIKNLTKEKTSKPSKTGSLFHDWIAKIISGEKTVQQAPLEIQHLLSPAIKWWKKKEFLEVEVEQITINKAAGYGGTIDIAAKAKKPYGDAYLCIGDWKSKKTSPRDKIIKPYPQHPEQIAAYAASRWPRDFLEKKVFGWNAFVSTTERNPDTKEARFEVVYYSPNDLLGHYLNFTHLLNFWINRNFDSRQK